MTTMTVPVVMPEKVWGRLASVAEGRGTTIAALLADQVVALLPAESAPIDVLRSELGAARKAGFRIPRRGLSAEDRAWRAEQKRRQNLESFRRMDTVWEESA